MVGSDHLLTPFDSYAENFPVSDLIQPQDEQADGILPQGLAPLDKVHDVMR